MKVPYFVDHFLVLCMIISLSSDRSDKPSRIYYKFVAASRSLCVSYIT